MRHSDRTTMETFTGGWFDFDNMDPDDIDVRDIAQALALTCRFGGQIPFFYSVGQHALLVSELVHRHFQAGSELAFAALHHDSHEAYVGDVPTPLKNTFGEAYDALVDRLDDVISFRLGIPPANLDHPVIHKADRLALFIEAATLKVSRGVGPAWGNDEVCPEARDYKHWIAYMEPGRIANAFMREHWRLGQPSMHVMHHSV